MTNEIAQGATGGERLTRTLDSWRAAEVLSTPDLRQEFFYSLTIDEFDYFIAAVNKRIVGNSTEYRGYLPESVTTFQTDDDDAPDVLGTNVLYKTVSPMWRRMMVDEVFDASQQVDDANVAVTLLGIGMVAIHPLAEGHTRTMAIGRQLLAPEGRGYSGTAEDKAFYNDLIAKRGLYLKQSLHPIRANLPQKYAEYETQDLLTLLGYTGPTPRIRPFGPLRGMYTQMPEQWGPNERFSAAIVLSEPGFGLGAMLAYMLRYGWNIEDFMEPSTTPLISVPAFMEAMPLKDDGAALVKELFALDAHRKNQFVRAIIRCIASDETRIFGNPEEVLKQYRLPGPTTTAAS